MFDEEVACDVLTTADSVWESLADLAVTPNDSFEPRCGCRIETGR